MGIIDKLFGGGAQKHEDKGDELRLDLMYRDAAYYYQKALDALKADHGLDRERISGKLRDARRKALGELIEDATEHLHQRALGLAREKLEMARGYVDDPLASQEVERRLTEVDDLEAEDNYVPPPAGPEEVTGTEEDLFELAISGLDPADREIARELGEPFRIGYEACQTEAWEQALEQFELLLQDQPDQELVLELAAMAHENLDQMEEAHRRYQRAYELNPRRASTVQGLVALRRRLDQPEAAAEVLAAAAEAVPAAPEMGEPWIEIHIDHSRTLSSAGRFEEAVSVLHALLTEVREGRGVLYHNLGGVLEEANRLEEARAALEAAIQAAMGSSFHRERLSDFLVAHDPEALDTALRLLVEAHQVETVGGAGMFGGTSGGKVLISPHRPRYLYKMARIYYLKGEDLEAERTITSALSSTRDPKLREALEALRADLRDASDAS